MREPLLLETGGQNFSDMGLYIRRIENMGCEGIIGNIVSHLIDRGLISVGGGQNPSSVTGLMGRTHVVHRALARGHLVRKIP